MMNDIIRTALATVSVFVFNFAVAAETVKVDVDVDDEKAEVPRTLYGTGMEDVNHEIYGGLDAQRLWDESFEEELPPQHIPYAPTGKKNIYCGRQWEEFATGDGVFARDTKVAHFGQASEMLATGTGSAGVANRGLNGWGVPCREGKKMKGWFYALGNVRELEVRLERSDGRIVYARTRIPSVEWKKWTKVSFELTPDRTDPAARFAVVVSNGGRMWLDDVYLADEPTNEFGRMGCREDIVAAFRKEGLTFLRWGGAMGNSPDYRLKNMKRDRRPYKGFWFPCSSTGFMIHEFVQMAELMKLPCAFSIYAYESTEDAVELARYLKRFKTDIYVQIGNEEGIRGGTKFEDYIRYAESVRRLVPEMRRENPRLKFVSAVWWRGERMEWMEETFRRLDGVVEYWDLHVLAHETDAGEGARSALSGFREMSRRINPGTTMKAAIFEENGFIHNMKRALVHARILEAAREAGDFLLTSCPANALQPYMQNDNGWDQGQIFFTPDKVWLQPCGWAQQMAARNHRDLLVAGKTDGGKDVTVSATRSRDGKSAVLHIVNSSAEAKRLDVGFGKTDGFRLERAVSLSASKPEEHNTPDDPDRVSPKDVTASMRAGMKVLPFSYTVLEYIR